MSICIGATVETLGLAKLTVYCTEELNKHRRKQSTDGSFCLELLRRATLLQIDEA